MIWPLGVLNRGTERRGSDEERTPSSSNRARRRTKLEVHGDARTRPKSARLRKRKETPSRIVPGPLLSPFKAPSGVRARDGRELSDTERAAFAKCMHFATRCGQASVADVCKEWGISKSHGYKILNRWRTEESVQSRPRSGRPCALTEEDMHTLECLSEELKGYFTWESLAKRFTEKTGKRVSCTAVYSSCKSAGWRQVCERYVPCLSATDVARRLEQYHEYHDRERLERCWDVKTAVTKCILDANGTNDYKLPHGIKHEEPIFVDIFLDSDDTDDPVARTLDYEGLHASLPSSLPR